MPLHTMPLTWHANIPRGISTIVPQARCQACLWPLLNLCPVRFPFNFLYLSSSNLLFGLSVHVSRALLWWCNVRVIDRPFKRCPQGQSCSMTAYFREVTCMLQPCSNSKDVHYQLDLTSFQKYLASWGIRVLFKYYKDTSLPTRFG